MKSVFAFCAFLFFSSCDNQEHHNVTSAAPSPTNDSNISKTADSSAESLHSAGAHQASNALLKDSIVRKLQKIYKNDIDKNLIDTQSRKFSLSEFDLNDDSAKEVFVALNGPYFCGSGGCTILLLDNSLHTLTTFTVTTRPLLIADTKTKGWKDLVLESRGKKHLIKFNGKKYPPNPSVEPLFTPPVSNSFIKALDTAATSATIFNF